jgi:hypothetical protein
MRPSKKFIFFSLLFLLTPIIPLFVPFVRATGFKVLNSIIKYNKNFKTLKKSVARKNGTKK